MKNENYIWNAEDYAGHSTAQQIWARELIAKLNLIGDENVLDIGCGDGKVTAEIAAQVPEGSVLGIDNSAAMIDLACRQFPSKANKNLSFRVEDARDLPFTDQFDVVFSNAVLHWIIDHKSVLTGISLALKTGGRFLLQMGGKGNAAELVVVLEQMMRENRWQSYFKDFKFPYGFYGPEEYQKWMKIVDLQPVRSELIPKDMAHDPEGLAGWIRTTWLPYTQRVPEEKREVLIQELMERYINKHPADQDGKVHVGMVRLEVEGKK